MILRPLAVEGAFVVEPEKQRDDRGFFARTFCADDFAAAGLESAVSQVSISFNQLAGTLRGLHYQAAPHGEAKLVRCTRGRAFDVIVDVRPASPTYRVVAVQELDAEEHLAVFAPVGVAHGFVTLEPATELLYQISTPYHPTAGRGIRWDDPGVDIPWPVVPSVVSERDRTYPDHPW